MHQKTLWALFTITLLRPIHFASHWTTHRHTHIDRQSKAFFLISIDLNIIHLICIQCKGCFLDSFFNIFNSIFMFFSVTQCAHLDYVFIFYWARNTNLSIFAQVLDICTLFLKFMIKLVYFSKKNRQC